VEEIKEEYKEVKGKYDVIIIGAGLVGAVIARWLSKYELDILLIDKEPDVGTGTSKANTAIVHAGYDSPFGTLRGKLVVKGNRMFYPMCEELDVPYKMCGTYVVALTDEDMKTLERLMENGRKKGVPGLEIISGEEMRHREPLINPEVKGALYAPTGGISDPFALTVAAAENAVMNGVKLMLETKALDFVVEPFSLHKKRVRGVITNRGTFLADVTIASAGLYCDELMEKLGIKYDFYVRARKGEYYVFDKAKKDSVHTVLFPCPTPITKGILVTTSIFGNMILGPTAYELQDKEDTSVRPEGLKELREGAKRLVPSLEMTDVIRTFAGLRAGGYLHDFIIEAPAKYWGFINLAGIESPGMASSPAIAEYVVNLVREQGLELREKKNWNPIRKARPDFSELSPEEQARLIEKDPRYGRIVCRCETVTEGEIVAEIHAPVPARTYDALKRRTHLGMGRCQGSFDTPRVIEILSRELGIPPTQVIKERRGSNFLTRPTKEVPEGG